MTRVYFLIFLLFSSTSFAQKKSITIEITNLMHGSYFTPILVVSHNKNLDFFNIGESATTAMQAMAEGGDISILEDIAITSGANVLSDPASGLLAPGETASGRIAVNKVSNLISIMAMILPTNDGFVGLDSARIALYRGKKSRTTTFYLKAYDAGTEVNNELLNTRSGGIPGVLGMPGNPTGQGGSGGSGAADVELNKTIHPHPGIVGDKRAMGGLSDLITGVHNWSDPVAKVVIRY